MYKYIYKTPLPKSTWSREKNKIVLVYLFSMNRLVMMYQCQLIYIAFKNCSYAYTFFKKLLKVV